MTTKHTPGPWKAHKPAQSESSENAANARLIAAAPELLAACKALLPHVEGMIERANPGHTDTSAYSDQTAVKIARAAIAKAEGTT